MSSPLFQKLEYITFFKILLSAKSNETKIIAFIIRFMDYDNRIYVDRSEVSSAVDCSEDTVNNIIKDLVCCDFIRPNGRNRYMVNPKCLYKGSKERLYFLQKDFDGLI